MSAGSRLSANDPNATLVPSAEILGISLLSSPFSPLSDVETRVISPGAAAALPANATDMLSPMSDVTAAALMRPILTPSLEEKLTPKGTLRELLLPHPCYLDVLVVSGVGIYLVGRHFDSVAQQSGNTRHNDDAHPCKLTSRKRPQFAGQHSPGPMARTLVGSDRQEPHASRQFVGHGDTCRLIRSQVGDLHCVPELLAGTHRVTLIPLPHREIGRRSGRAKDLDINVVDAVGVGRGPDWWHWR